MSPIKEVLTDQELLYLALDHISSGAEYCMSIEYSYRILFVDCANELGPTATNEEILELAKRKLSQHIIDKMTQQGFLEEDIDGNIELTLKGRLVALCLKNSR